MQKVEGSSPFSRSLRRPAFAGLLCFWGRPRGKLGVWRSALGPPLLYRCDLASGPAVSPRDRDGGSRAATALRFGNGLLARDDTYKEWVYTAMTRATSANRLYFIAERDRGRDEFALAEPVRDGRMLLAAALMRSREDQLAIQHRIASGQSDRGIER